MIRYNGSCRVCESLLLFFCLLALLVTPAGKHTFPGLQSAISHGCVDIELTDVQQ